MKDSQECLKCSSTKLLKDLKTYDDAGHAGSGLAVKVYAKPEATIMKDQHESMLRAYVCCECGYTELFVEKPDVLLWAYEKLNLGSK